MTIRPRKDVIFLMMDSPLSQRFQKTIPRVIRQQCKPPRDNRWKWKIFTCRSAAEKASKMFRNLVYFISHSTCLHQPRLCVCKWTNDSHQQKTHFSITFFKRFHQPSLLTFLCRQLERFLNHFSRTLRETLSASSSSRISFLIN